MMPLPIVLAPIPIVLVPRNRSLVWFELERTRKIARNENDSGDEHDERAETLL